MPELRLFLAIETPGDVRGEMFTLQDSLKAAGADVRWELEEKFHATLKFLGETKEELLPEIVSSIRGVCELQSSLDVKYSGIGCFPNHREPRVVWIGIEDLKGNLAGLQKALEDVLVPLGFQAEQRKFHAHVTLGRVKSQRNVRGLLAKMESSTFGSRPVPITKVELIRSVLKRDGSVYTTLNVFPLSG